MNPNWRAGCGRTASPVRREGERNQSPLPTPIYSPCCRKELASSVGAQCALSQCFAPPELQASLESWFYKHWVPPEPKSNRSGSAFFAPSGRDVYSLVIPASKRSSGAQCCFAAANNSCSHISLLTERGYLRLPVAINISPRWGEITKGVLLHFKLESTI